MNFIAIIPARFASTRLPGKPLLDIVGKPMVVRVMEQAQASGADRVIVATDHPDVAEVVIRHGGEVCLTRTDHHSGTERLAEVIEQYGFAPEQIIVNVQGDEPLIPPQIIREVAENLAASETKMATLAVAIDDMQEIFNPNVVKVVRDMHGHALYFSRAPVPWDREQFPQKASQHSHLWLRHLGIYAYRAGFIQQYVSWQESPLEQIELLEQLRVLWYGERIHVGITQAAPHAGVDTREDLQRVIAALHRTC
ncbi:MAG: 3-deoxy-manno-octulosonate cytidylyltransferase [Enterobacteriaceae bacterium]